MRKWGGADRCRLFALTCAPVWLLAGWCAAISHGEGETRDENKHKHGSGSGYENQGKRENPGETGSGSES